MPVAQEGGAAAPQGAGYAWCRSGKTRVCLAVCRSAHKSVTVLRGHRVPPVHVDQGEQPKQEQP